MIAIDTNILIYACDQSDSRRQSIALELISNCTDGTPVAGCVRVSRLHPANSASRVSLQLTLGSLSEFQDLLPLVLPVATNLNRAKELNVTHAVSLWDALILAACVEAGVNILCSEDLPGLSTFETVRVINPFQ